MHHSNTGLNPKESPGLLAISGHLPQLLTLNFSFDSEHYQQISGVAMGTKMGPSYANLFVGYVEKQIFEQYTNDYHPALKLRWEISQASVSFLDILESINGNVLATSFSYKPTDSYSYLLFSSFHPNHTKQSIPCSQFLRLCCLCSDDKD